jgi:hypothetical protein
VVRLLRRQGTPVFFGTSSDSFKWFVGAVMLGYVYCIYRLGSGLPGGLVLQYVLPLAGVAALFRLLNRRVWIFDDRRMELHGFWYSLTLQAADATAVTYVKYWPGAKSFEGHRIYVTVCDRLGRQRAMCISSNMKEWSARTTAEGLLDAIALYSGRERLELAEAMLPPEEAARGWLVPVDRLRGRRAPRADQTTKS